MTRAYLRYVKYALSTLASVGFAAKTSWSSIAGGRLAAAGPQR